MKKMHTRGALLAVSLVWAFAAHAQELSMASAINKAGRQRMLSQRMIKDYCQIGLDVRRDEARQQLQEAVKLFDAQLRELKAVGSPAVQGELDTVAANWKPFQTVLAKPFNKDELRQLMDLGQRLYEHSNRVVLMLQDESGKPLDRLINVSGRQRMLSQRIAMFYLCRRAGLNDASTLDGLDQVRNEFKGALLELKAAPVNSAEINKGLDAADTQWALLDYSIAHSRDPLEEFVAITSDKILAIMEDVTRRYEAVLR